MPARPLPLARSSLANISYNLPEPFYGHDFCPPQTKEQQFVATGFSRDLSDRITSAVQSASEQGGCGAWAAWGGGLEVGRLYFVPSRRWKRSSNRRNNSSSYKPSNSIPHRFLAQNVPLATALHGSTPGPTLAALQAQGD
jgi:hypothetical protein